MRLYYFIFTILFGHTAMAQFDFRSSSSKMAYPEINSGLPVGIADINGDFIDDIIVITEEGDLVVYVNRGGTQGVDPWHIGKANSSQTWSIAVGDVNNDGFADILAAGLFEKPNLVYGARHLEDVAIVDLPISSILAQTSTMSDINNDGWLDLMICNHQGTNRVLENRGDGTFKFNNTWLNFNTEPLSDNAGSRGATWSDIDWDGDPDLYISKSVLAEENPNAPSRTNQLLVNDNGLFWNLANSKGLALKSQSIATEFGDMDNDGDMDAVVVSANDPVQILENQDNIDFADITSFAGIEIQDFNTQVKLADFDNDSDLDLIIAGEKVFFYENQGGFDFDERPAVLDIFPYGSFCLGDLDQNGSIDVYTSYTAFMNTPTIRPDDIWLNYSEPDNHFLQVGLLGSTSNASGVGARVELKGRWGTQIREVRSGEGFGIQNSLNVHFGLGRDDIADSLIIYWPSGIIDRHPAVMADRFYFAHEGGCLSPRFEVEMSGSQKLCPGDSVILTSVSAEGYLWSTGETTRSIVAKEQGKYSVLIQEANGCERLSEVVFVELDPDDTPTLVFQSGDVYNCDGDAVFIGTQNEANAYLWSNGRESAQILVTAPGSFSVTVEGTCRSFESDTIEVNYFTRPDAPEASWDTIRPGERATLTATGELPHWYEEETDFEPVHIGHEYVTERLFASADYYVSDQRIHRKQQYRIGEQAHTGDSKYNFDGLNAALIFDSYKDITLEEVTCYTDFAGLRRIVLLNAQGETIDEHFITMSVGANAVNLDWEIPAGLNYRITTDTLFNQINFGAKSPFLWRSNTDDIAYPYAVEDLISIKKSNVVDRGYYYFYDWRLRERDHSCHSLARTPVRAVVSINTNTADENLQDLKIVPNPAQTLVRIEDWPVGLRSEQLTLLDVHGRIALSKTDFDPSQSIDIADLSPGVYLVIIRSGEASWRQKLVIQH